MEERKKITKEDIAVFLDGHNPQERIVDLEYNYQDDFITVWYRNDKDEKCSSTESFYPFVWAKLDACLKMCGGNRMLLQNTLRVHNIWLKKLSTENNNGDVVEEMLNGYQFLFFATQPMSYADFLNFFKSVDCPVYPKNKDNTAKKDERLFLMATPQEQYLISTGKRFFKGYDDYNQLLRMIFDLETEGLDPTKDRIKLNGVRLNRAVTIQGKRYENFERIFRVEGNTNKEKDDSELKVIDTMFRLIYTFRPDIITAHNGENFDWNFIIERCKQLGEPIEEFSKKYFNGKFIYKDKKESILKLGGEMETFHKTIVPHTIITDSLHAVRRAQALDSNMQKADLKYVTEYSGMKKPNRVYVPGHEIDRILIDTEEHYAFNNNNGDWYLIEPTAKEYSFDGNPHRNYVAKFSNVAEGYKRVTGQYVVERYLYDDLYECDVVEHRYNVPNFLICKMLPVPFARCCTMGTAGQWKALMMAWSYENDLAIPAYGENKSFTGGLSRLLSTGYVANVAKFDYNSLYPSIILTWGISDKKDLMGTMLAFLEHVLTQREKYKKLKKVAGKKKGKLKEELANFNGTEEERKKLEQDLWQAQFDESANDKKQLPLKILGNSFFGSFGCPTVFPWASIDCAERTTCTGRQCLRLMIKTFSDLGYKPIVGDTDGFNFKLPDDAEYRYTESNPYVSTGLSRETEKDKKYAGFKADVAEFNDKYMSETHCNSLNINKMGLGIDEIVSATCNFARKNYADFFPDEPFPNDVKLVGNTVKSKKMPEFIAKFLEKGVRLILRNKGQEFLEAYYDYIDKIYNYRIPLKDIASKGKVKKSIPEYIEDCKTVTKAGTKKARQAWMELAVRDGLKVNLGDTLYFINTGEKKLDSDVKRITHFYGHPEGQLVKEEIDMIKIYTKEYNNSPLGKLLPKTERPSLAEYIRKYHPEAREEDEIVLCCSLLPNEIVESDVDYFCEEGKEYNAAKYIDQFNSRITPLLVCFSKDIRSKILITNPVDRQYFTEKEAALVCGQPNKEGDQDTYEQLMTMDDKEIKFWLKHPEWEIPFLKECGMDWEKISGEYLNRIEQEKQNGVDKIREVYDKAIENMTMADFNAFEEGKLPSALDKIIKLDASTNNFVAKNYPDVVIGTIFDILEAREQFSDRFEERYEV